MLSRKEKRREGAIAPLTAILCVFLVGMVAFAVDLAWMVLTETELQNAADSAALAASNDLLDPYVQYQLPGQSEGLKSAIVTNALAGARATAKKYAAYNGAGEKNTLALSDEDIEFGFTDAKGVYSSTYKGFPNTVKVTIRRDTKSNGSLPLFFAPVLGNSSADLRAVASATIYAGAVNDLKAQNGKNIALLPMTYDVNHWNEFLKTGRDPDGGMSKSEDGTPQLLVYPTFQDKGNFGQLALDDAHAGSSEIRDWINNGITQNDLDVLVSRGLLPLSTRGAGTQDWLGNPGMRASTIMEVNDQTGGLFLLPLFRPANADPDAYSAGVGNCSHYNYNIVQFVGVRIMPVKQSNKGIVVVPAANVDPSLVFAPNSVVPAGTSGNFETTFAAPRLSR